MTVGEQIPQYAGDYALESRLGSGGMGVVHLARSASGRLVAVKVVHEQFAADPEFRARFQQEVAAARRVSGAFTAPVVDADADAARPWMATLYVPALTLSEKVKKEGPFGLAELWRLAAGLAEALHDIHRAGVVHRDLKPSNVLLADDGPKVIDFGISRPFDSELRTETGKVIGTPPFMAPEQFRTPRDVGPAADIFALGCLLVHAARGRGPFDAESPYLVAYQVVHDEPDLGDVPPRLRPLVRRCLAKDPAERPTPRDLMVALRGTRVPFAEAPLEGGELDPGPDTEPEAEAPAPRRAPAWRLPPRPRPGLRVALLAGAAAVLLAGGGFVYADQLRPAAAPTAVSATASARDGKTAGRDAKVWETPVARAAGAGPVHAPRCASTRTALFCTDDGVAAARIGTADGHVAWTRKAAWADRWTQPPALSGGLVQVVRPGRTLQALDPRDGRPRWSRALPADTACCDVAGGTVVLRGPGGTFTALSGATGQQRWSGHVPGHADPVLATFGDGLYAVSKSADGGSTLVSAVRPQTGAVLWSHRFPGQLTVLGAGGGALYLAEADPRSAIDTRALVRYDPAARTAVRTPLPYPFPADGSASFSGRTAYLLSDSGLLVAVDTHRTSAAHAKLWELQTAVSNPSPATVSGGHLYLGAPDGRLLGVDLRRGELTAQTAPRNDPAARGMLAGQQAPVVLGGRVYGFTPRGTVFSVARTALDR
jgi:outer membrane protein assembly factor BamB